MNNRRLAWAGVGMGLWCATLPLGVSLARAEAPAAAPSGTPSASAPSAPVAPVGGPITGGPAISVGPAKRKKAVVAFAPIKKVGDTTSAAKIITDTVTADLTFIDQFTFLGSAAFTEAATAGITPGSFKMTDWSGIGAEFVIKAQLAKAEGGALALEAYVYDVVGGKQVLGKKYNAAASDAKTLARTLGNDIVHALTGMPGLFLTKIAMSCDRTGKKEIYIMDFDGTNVKQITHNRSIAFAPAWHPSGTRLAYSLFAKNGKNETNIDLYEFDFTTNNARRLANKKGINSGAAYSPDGSKIAVTMSFLGNPEIFLLDPSSGTTGRLTNSFGFDVDPTWSPDGKTLAFVSSRSGQPMVFSMAADGTKPTRLTFAGRYNATPSWSPQNNKIAFAGWLDGRFDIFIMNPDGTNIERLTKNQGGNEDPYFSPDGGFIVFSSNRTGQKNIYVMNIDGTYTKRLTYGLGNCVAPKWSNPPK